ncbi:hypothetical protein [Massilia sp. SYSU DXS3249]
MQLSTYRHVVRASALYDVLFTAALATPWSQALAHGLMSGLNQQLGGSPLPPFGTFHVFIAGLLGSVVVVWSVLRIRRPSLVLGRYDGMARLLFSAWMAWTLAQGGAPVLWLLLVPETSWGVVQWWPVGRAQPGGVRGAVAA